VTLVVIRVRVKNVPGGKFLKINAVVINAMNAVILAFVKDVTGGNFGKIKNVFPVQNAMNVVSDIF
jgi:hypothetical protein